MSEQSSTCTKSNDLLSAYVVRLNKVGCSCIRSSSITRQSRHPYLSTTWPDVGSRDFPMATSHYQSAAWLAVIILNPSKATLYQKQGRTFTIRGSPEQSRMLLHSIKQHHAPIPSPVSIDHSTRRRVALLPGGNGIGDRRRRHEVHIGHAVLVTFLPGAYAMPILVDVCAYFR